ncbi:MAG: GDYXXLXY domain-containing protein [Planctomycetia bacterium]|nr:GDYXXLXY domain-containing protein [Planctomycetia bacterium]
MQSEPYPLAEALPLRPWDRRLAWIKERERGLLAVAVGFQVLVLLAMLGMRAVVLVRGETVLLRVAHVYDRRQALDRPANLSYEFNQLPPGGILGLPPGTRDQAVFVTLIRDYDGRHWRMGTMTTRRPTTDGKYLQGRFDERGGLEFGIENYLLPEGQYSLYERAARERRLSAEVVLTVDGQAALRGLHLEE